MVNNYNPDVLNCIANLSNDEVFTPPVLANRVLDMLPQELFKIPDTTFLDPFTKSGVFLREIVKRLDRGLESQIPDRQERIDHIMHKQVFGIACTELTAHLSRRSLYCTKHPDGKYSVSCFDNPEGNIQYKALKHTWEGGKCKFCGASKGVYDRGDAAEQYAYQFIHTENPESIFNMKFDVIIGNPPYQLNDGTGGNGTSATPIYHKFIEQAVLLSPRYISMIIPSRWFSGGKGLDDFRFKMLNDKKLREIHDYLEASECFPGVQIKGGINYFLWAEDHKGDCTIYTHRGGEITSQMTRPLIEKGGEYLIRFNEAIEILHKVQNKDENLLFEQISSSKPFGLRSNFDNYKEIPTKECNIRLIRYGEDVYVSKDQLEKGYEMIDKYKVLVSKAGSGSDTFPHQILGKPIIAEPGTACTETYVVIGVYDTLEEAKNLKSYIETRFFRFMVSLIKNTQNAAKRVYKFVPLQDFSHPWTDEMLYRKYGLTEEEIDFIESMIRPM